MEWFDTAHCRSGEHCRECRHSERFRESLVKAGFVPDRDIDCPFGMSPPSPNEGPDTRLMRLLCRLGFHHSPRCVREDMAPKMDPRDPDQRRENVEEIPGVMRKAAGDLAPNPMRLLFVVGGAENCSALRAGVVESG